MIFLLLFIINILRIVSSLTISTPSDNRSKTRYTDNSLLAQADIPSWNRKYANFLCCADKALLESAVRQFMSTWNISGLTLALAKDGQLAYANGFGYAIRPESKNLCAGELTKMITSPGERMSTRHTGRGASGFAKTATSIAIHKLSEE